MNIESVFWAITLSLFLGALGLPLPENPILIGGGYAIFRGVCSPGSLWTWYLAILLGDTVLFAVAYWFFRRPGVACLLRRLAGADRLATYQKAFTSRGAATLFLARFTFGLRAVAYVAAGAAHYPWKKFLAADAISVAIQVLLFAGIGFYAGDRVDWARTAGARIVLIVGCLALLTILVSWGSTLIVKKWTTNSPSQPAAGVGTPPRDKETT
jgi:membrane protein DedA with SNARE-associated domain